MSAQHDAAPQRQKETEMEMPPHAPYTAHSVQAGEVRLNYLDYGTPGKPLMLCIHGGAANAHWFDFIAPGFTADYHVLSLDLRGHGDSQHVDPPSYTYEDYAEDIHKAVDALDLRDFVLIGHSMGGAVSLMYAANYPGRVKALILVDSTVNLPKERIEALRSVGERPGRTYHSKDEIVSRYRLRPGDSTASPALVRYIGENSVREMDDGTWRYKFDRNVYATREMSDGRPNWNRIKVPAMMVKGDRSPRITPEVFADLKARCPQAELAEVTNSDHHVTLDNPAMFIEKVSDFLKRNSSS